VEAGDQAAPKKVLISVYNAIDPTGLLGLARPENGIVVFARVGVPAREPHRKSLPGWSQHKPGPRGGSFSLR
jgi:hypothetical protein